MQPRPLRRMIALARELAPELGPAIDRHYGETMPAQRDAHRDPLLHTRLDWARLPRMSAALDRLYALLAAHGLTFLAPSAAALRAETATLAELYARTHYGGCMPLLYGGPADLAYISSREPDVHAAIDRYLVAPILHELCHFAPERDALPPHLDECIAGWLAVHVWPEFAYPAPGGDDAIYAAPWLAQIGQAFARAHGVGPIVRAHAGAISWADVVPLAAIEAFARADWARRRTLHFLSDTLDPAPWIALAGLAGAPPDDDFDRRIVADGLRAMCLATACIDGSFRTRSVAPDDAIAIDAGDAGDAGATPWIRRGAERYWLPPPVAARIRARGHRGYALQLGGIAAIPHVVATLVDGTPPAGCSLVPY